MRLFIYTSQSFVQSYPRFERSCHVYIFSTSSDNAGIGFPRQYEHSYFFSAS